MFGKRATSAVRAPQPEAPAALPESVPAPAESAPAPPKLAVPPAAKPAAPKAGSPDTNDRLHDVKVGVFAALLDAVDLKELAKRPPEGVREDLPATISETVNTKKSSVSAR